MMTDLIIINYFDWSGNKNGLMSWIESVRAQCEKQEVRFRGLYGPS